MSDPINWNEGLPLSTLSLLMPDILRYTEENSIFNKETKDMLEKEEQKLKSCPFCGGKGRLHKHKKYGGNINYSITYVECEECHCRTNELIVTSYYGIKHTIEEVIDAWNRRRRKWL